MTTPDPLPAKKKLLSRIAAAQKLADAAKKAAKLAKASARQAKQKFKEAKRAAKKQRKELKSLKAELAKLTVKKKPAHRPAAGPATKRPGSPLAPAPIVAPPLATEPAEFPVSADALPPPVQ